MMMLALVAGLVQVEGTADCPSATEVAERLTPMLSDRGARAVPDRVNIEPTGSGIRLELRDGNGVLAATRILARAACADLAVATAVVIAAWETQHRSLSTPNVTLPSPPRPILFDVAGGFLGAVGGGFAAGGLIQATLGRPGSGLGVWIEAGATDERSLALPPGRVLWTRAALAVGARYRFAPKRLLIDLHAEVIGAFVHLRSDGFSVTDGAGDFDPGLGGGVRAALRFGPFAPFFGVAARGWLRAQTGIVGGITGNIELPRAEILVSAGLSVGRF